MHHMDAATIMDAAGLNAREAALYLACVEHGPESISALARLSGEKRSTTHYLLERLLRRGLVIRGRRGKRSLFDAQRPQRLLSIARERERTLEGIIPQLEAMRHGRQPQPTISVFDGEHALHGLYRDIYDHLGKGAEFLTSINDLETHLPLAARAYVNSLRALPKPQVRELIWDEHKGRQWIRMLRKQKFHHPCRLLECTDAVRNDFVIFGNRVAIFSFRKRPTAIVIDDPDVASTMKALYAFAWECGREP
jgi:DNA-binding MarR family transcriptional regulator